MHVQVQEGYAMSSLCTWEGYAFTAERASKYRRV